jgi:hypothetical protein
VPIKLFGGTEDADLSKRYRDMGVLRIVMTLPPELAEKTFRRGPPLGRVDPSHQRVRRADQRGQSVGAAWRTFARVEESTQLSGLNRPPADPGVPDGDVDATQTDRGWPW